MALNDEIPDASEVAFDTNTIIYFVERDVSYHALLLPVFVRIADGSVRGHASVISLLEVLVKPLRDGLGDLARQYREILAGSPNFTLHPLTAAVAERAAEIRAMNRLGVADSIISATAIEASCTHFLTNDPAFRRVNDNLKVLVISDFVAP